MCYEVLRTLLFCVQVFMYSYILKSFLFDYLMNNRSKGFNFIFIFF